MIHRLISLVALMFTLTGALSISAKPSRVAARAQLQNSLVELEVNRKQYDYQMPWTRSSGSIRKSALVIGPTELLTTADGLADRTLVRAQRDGRGKWWEAEVIWIDYHANLAVIATKDAEFWKGAKVVELASKLSPGEEFEIHRWRSGNMEVRKAELNQFQVIDAKLSFVQYAQVELSSDVSGVGWGEPLMVGNRVAGLITSQTRNLCVATPAPFIRSVLEARRKGAFRGLGFFDFVWQPSENPAVHRYLDHAGDTRGVVVIEGARELGQTNVIKPRDLILEVDGSWLRVLDQPEFKR